MKNYCFKNIGEVFDLDYEKKHCFALMDEKFIDKYIESLLNKNVIIHFDKNVYLIINNRKTTFDPVTQYYGNLYRGVIVGYDMYNKYQITNYNDNKVVIYTNAMLEKQKELKKKYILKNVNFVFGDIACTIMIHTLEMIENKKYYIIKFGNL